MPMESALEILISSPTHLSSFVLILPRPPISNSFYLTFEASHYLYGKTQMEHLSWWGFHVNKEKK